MKIYNTLTKQIEEFKSITPGLVKMYTCGPTVYHYAHIGNIRTYIFEDILEKTLNYIGYDVKRVMNITDVGHLADDSDTGEDKMLKAAKRDNMSVTEIAEFYTKEFYKDIDSVNVKRPEIISKATDNINEYIKVVDTLLDKEYAYKSNGNIYFDVDKYSDYYKLSGINKEELLVGVRDDVEEDNNKHNPADFGLWFTNSKFDHQALKWDSPFGEGYPGWHIECSCIAMKYLGDNLDIHCGGVDNIFPHHSNEIAQSECYLGHKWCNYWVHSSHLNDKFGKMSKSNGEFLTIKSLIDKGYDPLVYRLLCLQSHYRNNLVFSYEAMDNAKNTYDKLISKISDIKDTKEDINEELVNDYINKFTLSLENDLNTTNTITYLFDILKDDNLNDSSKLYLIKEYDKVLSLDLIKEEKKISDELKLKVNELIEKRQKLKEEKKYEEADKIRDEILSLGAEIKDTREGTIIKWI